VGDTDTLFSLSTKGEFGVGDTKLSLSIRGEHSVEVTIFPLSSEGTVPKILVWGTLFLIMKGTFSVGGTFFPLIMIKKIKIVTYISPILASEALILNLGNNR